MRELLKFITCGSVDDGKSTLIGHMLYDAKLLYIDQEYVLELDSRIEGKEGKIDYSLLLDGLLAEREQGITIDVAYRYFSTEKRSFIVADTPGHEEYTRNMAVGASFADLAVILLDATKGILEQTMRHVRICALMGIKYFVFVVNKMDLVEYSYTVYKKHEKNILRLVQDLKLLNVEIIPVSATEGDNVTFKSHNMIWYRKYSLLEFLETVNVKRHEKWQGFVMPVQRVCRPNCNFRGFQGQIELGSVTVGDEITVLPSREKANVQAILWTNKNMQSAYKGQPVTIQLNKEIDISRGCVLVNRSEIKVGNTFTATLLWMDDMPLVPGKIFLLKLGTKIVHATMTSIRYRIDINTGEQMIASILCKNEIAICEFILSEEIVYDIFENFKELGCFILIDRITNMTSACGIIENSLQGVENLVWQRMDITRDLRANKMGQKPLTLWFTGLSGAGKSTLANEIEKVLSVQGKYTMFLDGDNIRMGLNKNLGFEVQDRSENVRRVAEVAKLMNDAGLIVLTAFISPYRSDRAYARKTIGDNSFIEIYLSTSLEECERRDVKGLYKKAREGKISNFTGISSVYEPPENPEIQINTDNCSIEDAVNNIISEIKKYL